MASTLKLGLLLLSSLLTLAPTLNQMLHPLDPLTPSELTHVQTTVTQAYNTSKYHLTFHYVGLDEPDKPTLLSWLSTPTANKTLPRRAFAIVRLNGKSHEIVVDLSTGSITSDNVHEGQGYPLVNLEEENLARLLPLSYEPFVESIKQRGLSMSEVDCFGFTGGWYGEEKTRRVLMISCYYLNGTVNYHVRPLEGITVAVDLDELRVVEYRDRVRVPLPKAEGTEYRWSMLKEPLGPHLNHFNLVQPQGSGLKIDGRMVRSVLEIFLLLVMRFLLTCFVTCNTSNCRLS